MLCVQLYAFAESYGTSPHPPRLEPCMKLSPHTAQHFQIRLHPHSVPLQRWWKFLLHFIDVHRYISPATTADYLCIRSFRKLGAFAVGVFFDSSYPSRGRLSRPPTPPPLPPRP